MIPIQGGAYNQQGDCERMPRLILGLRERARLSHVSHYLCETLGQASDLVTNWCGQVGALNVRSFDF